ncbi:ABC transporter ATP-binding protein [Gilliamella sp. B2969]|uniref:ABC transporter ATP-binding protein n=1 Tax=Gilliamella sp. B2969 TaxID=2818021 RepID=UPI00226A9C5B|nr:ABC transporter ATP-binding protein [Gilliamella sp. B2969]MCX8729379.1 ABC transporter ATP-binding protein [Gilliamella sp. B2969]
MKSGNKTASSRLWELAFNYKVLMTFACLFSIVSVAVSFIPFIAIYFIIYEIVMSISRGAALNNDLIINYGWLAFISAAVSILLNFLGLCFSHYAAFKTLYHLKYNFVRYLSLLPLGFFYTHSSGELRKIVDDDIEKIEQFIAHQLPDMVGAFASPVMIFIILAVFDWRLGLATLFPIMLAYIVLISGYKRQDVKHHQQEFQKRLIEMSNASVEYIRGITVVKAFNQTFFSFKRFYQSIKAYQLYCLKFIYCFKYHMAFFLLILNNIYLFIIPIIILLLGHTDNYAHFILSAIFYLIFSLGLPAPFFKLLYVTRNFQNSATSVQTMDAVLNIPLLPEPKIGLKTDHYDICFNDVNFSYSNNQIDDQSVNNNAISHITFTAKQGQTTALVGLSGSGKSTISLLIPRFFDPTSGHITIGGVDLKQMNSDYLLSLVSFVFQDVFLFKQRILDNIRIGKPHASLDEVIAAAKAAQCHDFIEKLPDGYNSVIGTQGLHLSGGEMQRLAIARALLKNSPILILDEATAFADPENEYKIQLALKALMKDKTVIMIAHRLSTIKDADQIIVLDKGHIVEKGAHQTLIDNHATYYKMWQYYQKTLDWDMPQSNQAVEANDRQINHVNEVRDV